MVCGVVDAGTSRLIMGWHEGNEALQDALSDLKDMVNHVSNMLYFWSQKLLTRMVGH